MPAFFALDHGGGRYGCSVCIAVNVYKPLPSLHAFDEQWSSMIIGSVNRFRSVY